MKHKLVNKLTEQNSSALSQPCRLTHGMPTHPVGIAGLKALVGGIPATFLATCVTLSVSLSCGCTSEETKAPGGLMLVTSTDLQIPKDVTHMGVQVLTSNGVVRHEGWYALGANSDQAKLPATLAIEPGANDDPVTIRIFARRDTAILALSETTTTVPRDRVALLRMPIEWLSVGMVQPTDASSQPSGTGGTSSSASRADSGTPGNIGFPTGQPGFDTVQTTCPADETPHAGTCSSSVIDSTTLPTFTLGQVFGHGTGNGDGSCYDTVGCFANSTPLIISDRINCTAPVTNTPDKLTLGLIPADGSGICGAGGCIVTLNYDASGAAETGWSLQNNLIQLPPAVCQKLNDGSLRAVVASNSCATKTPEVPNCGAWSSVDSAQASPPTQSDLLSVCWNFAKVACEGIGRCRGGSGFLAGVIEDDGTCTERIRFLCDASLTRPEAEPWRTYFENCGAAFAGSDCSQVEVKVRSACVEPTATSNPVAEGAACSFGHCGVNDVCLGAVPGGVGQCTARLGEGTAHCGTNSALDALFPQGACNTSLVCDHASQQCQTPGAVGSPCTASDSCRPNLVCSDSSCATPIGAASTCGDDTECAPGLHCVNASGVQQCRGPGQLGESCVIVAKNQQSVLWQENLCDISKGLRCDSETRKCSLARLVEQGATCTTLNSCAGGYCSGIVSKDPVSSGTCQGYVADGSACSQTTQCGPPAECLEQSCRLRPAFGCSAVTMQNVPGEQPCSTGQTVCDMGCVNLQTDPKNCGQCNATCAVGRQCQKGLCDCGTQEIRCGTACIAAQSDTQNCGKCGNQCATSETCVSGQCTAVCSSGLNLCGTTCVNIATDGANCGKCGQVCAAASSCVSGSCQSSTASGGSTSAGGTLAVGGKGPVGGAAQTGGTGVVTIGGATSTNGGTTNLPGGGTYSMGGNKSTGGTTPVVAGGTKFGGGTTSVATGGTSSVGGMTSGATGGTSFNGGATASSAGAITSGGVTAVSFGGTAVSTNTGATGAGVGGTSALSLGGTVAAAGTIGISTGGVGGVAGSSAFAQCPAKSLSSGGTAGQPSAPLSITAQGYVTSGDWQGFMWTAVDTLGSTISTPQSSITASGVGLCVNGQAVPGDLASNAGWAAFGFYVQQAITGEMLTITPTSAGVNIQVDNLAGSPLRVQIGGPNMAEDASQKWCAPIVENGGYIPWSAFNTHCWDGSGSPYRGEPLQSISIIATASSVLTPTAYSYCLYNIAEVGAVSQELVNPSGWIGGDINSTADDPFGIQGGFWAGGDGIAYTPPTGNPCNASGCCIQGQTILDPSYNAWGAEIGFDLGYFPNAQAASAPSVCSYRGNADCFDMVLTGSSGGNPVYLMARASPTQLPKGQSDPMLAIPAFSNGWSGRLCFADLACSTWSPDCKVTGNWYAVDALVVGGQRNADFSVCLTSLKAVQSR